jgi:hypothetical protein
MKTTFLPALERPVRGPLDVQLVHRQQLRGVAFGNQTKYVVSQLHTLLPDGDIVGFGKLQIARVYSVVEVAHPELQVVVTNVHEAAQIVLRNEHTSRVRKSPSHLQRPGEERSCLQRFSHNPCCVEPP